MPYISASGDISGSQTQQPWSVAKVVSIFWAVINFFYMLFMTLINPGSHARGDRYTQDYRSPGGGGAAVHHVTSESDLARQLKEAGRKLVVIDFFATWCGPCQMIAPSVAEMATQMSDVVFLKVDVDECDSIGASYGVRAMPTFVFIKNGSKVGSFSGANLEKLREFVYRYR